MVTTAADSSVTGGIAPVTNSGSDGTSGIVSPNVQGATQTNVTTIPPLTFDKGTQKARNAAFGLNVRDTDTNFDREIISDETRSKDLARDGTDQLLTQAQCDALQTCIDSLMSDLCGKTFAKREELITQADKIFDLACSQENRMKENILCQIEDAKCQFYRQASNRWASVSRAVGSSRNTFVIQQQDTAMADLTRKLASLRAELFNNAITASQQSLERAFSVQAVARLDNYERSFGNMVSLWGIIRGAKRVTSEVLTEDDILNKVSNEDSFQDVTMFDWSGKYSEQVIDASEITSAFAADYAQVGAIGGLIQGLTGA